MSGRLRIALLGCGRIGAMHADLLSNRVRGAELVTACDTVPDLAAELAARLGIEPADSVDDVLAGDRDVDAVAICTSTDTHAELITRAAEAGLPVFCEKPISLDLPTVDATIAAVDKAGTYLQVGFNRRFDAAHQAVQQAVASGSIGTLCLLKITSRDRESPPVSYLQRSGGMFLDMTIHDFDMARFITGSDIVEVHATGAALVDEAIGAIGDVDTSVVVMRHESGVISVIDNCRQAPYGYDQRVEALGTAGVATSENPPLHSAVVGDAAGIHAAALSESFVDRYETSFVRQWQSFVDNVTTGAPPAVSGHDARVPLVAGLAAIESLRSGHPVRVTPA